METSHTLWSNVWRLATKSISRSPLKALNVLRPRKVAGLLRYARTLERGEQRWNSAQWDRSTPISVRKYATYDEYVAHQRAKLDASGKQCAGMPAAQFAAQFRDITELPDAASILCLGARTGEEVEAFISLGHFAVGIDLNAGASNRYVVTGDFHKLQYADRSVDCVYTNCLDHAFDVARIAREAARVLKPSGLFIVEMIGGYEEGHRPGEWESTFWPTTEHLAQSICAAGDFTISRSSPIRNLSGWTRYIFRLSET